jgi:DNA-binding response OmpR family regulator
MPKRKPQQPGTTPRSDEPAGRAQRALLVWPDASARDWWQTRLASAGVSSVHAWSLSEGMGLARTDEFDLVLAAERLPDGAGVELVEALTASESPTVGVIVSPTPTLDGAVRAMRAGAADLWPADIEGPELRPRLRAVLDRAWAQRARRERIQRLRRLCRQLNGARQEVSRQVGSLCTDLAGAYRELSDQFGKVNLAAEFSGVVRQELEVESLLRTTLEFVLAKLGSTNAAIFLPAASGDYTLGAYVNYDVPKDTAEVLLDRLASVLAPAFEREAGVTVLETAPAVEARLGPHAEWLGDAALAALSCAHDGECLAVVILFRDRRVGFTEAHRQNLRVIGDLFGRQLARVIHVHHRHLPKDQWGRKDGGDDIDLAA